MSGIEDASTPLAEDPAEVYQRYRAVVENAFDMIQSVRPDGTFEFVNRAWREKLGYTPEEVERLIVWDVIHEESLAHCQVLFARAIGGESIDGVRATFVAKDGTAIPVEGNAASRFVDGRVAATYSFFRDISERMRGEALAKRNEQLERERFIRRTEKMAALGKLAAGLTHELNNPVAAIQRAGDLATGQWRELSVLTARLYAHGLDADLRRRLEDAAGESRPPRPAGEHPLARSDREEALAAWLEDRGVSDPLSIASDLVAAGFDEGRLARLTAGIPGALLADALRWLSGSLAMADLLDTMAVSARSVADLVAAVKAYSYMDRAQEQEIDVHDGLESTLLILGHKLKGGVRVHREYDRTLPRVLAPAGELNQVWTNILDNAIDACAPGGDVRIATFRQGGSLVVEIADTGAGIPEAIQPFIFDPFFTTKDIGEGTGLGLDVARRIVTGLCGGAITFESVPGDTRFRVSLPLPAAGSSVRPSCDMPSGNPAA